jgi:Xaa-Pro dipeptidase
VQNDEIVAFDTDLIGCYGICIDISRTWWVGDSRPTNAMISAMNHALDHIADHKAAETGVTIRNW